jgi:endonuclease/exonuclease/phosphatase family metal-dependent hydrolase
MKANLSHRNGIFSWVIFILINLILVSSCKKESLPLPEDIDLFAGCVIPGTKTSLEIVTLNVEEFPKDGDNSVIFLAELIKAMNPDVIALQEVRSETDFKKLDTLLTDWTGYLNPTKSQALDLAYLIKPSEIVIDPSSQQLLYMNDKKSFPRAPYEIKIKHKPTGKDIYLINIHLKCCDGAENTERRRSASVKLDLYIDTYRPKDQVIIIGDFNDKIPLTHSTANPFYNFYTKSEYYRFADLDIAKGNSRWWSYSSWPSHIDHILVTNELFSSIDTCFTINPSLCDPEYEKVISDHRPVEVKITF